MGCIQIAGAGGEAAVGEMPDEGFQLGGGFVESGIVLESGREGDTGRSGLIGIDFPGVHIKKEGPGFFKDGFDAFFEKRQRKEAEIGAAAEGENRCQMADVRWQRKKLSGCAAGRRDSETA